MASYDQAVPPGGEGRVTLTVDLEGYEGEVRKTAILYSNDPRRPTVTLTLKGRVRTAIEIRPSPLVRFQAGQKAVQERTLEIISEDRPFRILQIETDGEDWLAYNLAPLGTGKGYRLTLQISGMTRTRWGEVHCLTDHPEKPKLRIRVEVLP